MFALARDDIYAKEENTDQLGDLISFLKAKRTCFIKRISPNKERGWLVLVLWELFNSMRKFEDPL